MLERLYLNTRYPVCPHQAKMVPNCPGRRVFLIGQTHKIKNVLSTVIIDVIVYYQEF